MLTGVAFKALCDRLALSVRTRTQAEQIRSSEPSRRVGGGSTNVAARYPSRKMGFVIQAESQLELSAIYLKEHDPGVLEYYDQPPVLKLTYEAPRQQRVLYTPDFFVIEEDGMGWEEWRPEARLQRLSTEHPKRYQRDEVGQWHFLPGERYADPLGLFFRLRSSAEINPTLVRNLIMLQDYLGGDGSAPSERAITSLVHDRPGITLEQVLRYAAGDDIYLLVASGRLYTNLETVALADADRVLLFSDELTAQAYERLEVLAPDGGSTRHVVVEAGARIDWDGRGWRIVNAGQTSVALVSDEREVVDLPVALFEELARTGRVTGVPGRDDEPSAVFDLLSGASARELRRANDIFDLLRSGRTPGAVPARTLRRWRQQVRDAEAQYGRGYVGLLRRASKGNHHPKLEPTSLALMAQVIEEQYDTLTQPRRRSVYGELARRCQAQGVLCPSYRTFCATVASADQYRQTLKRRGPRAAYQLGEFVSYLDRNIARHGDRPFEVAHIDHTEADIEVRHSQTGKNLGRPWLTVMLDAYSRRILAFHLTFDPPSYRSCMAVIRECVRRHSRLPDTIVVDGGKEFASVYFETLLAIYGCTKKTRPATKARFGSVIERLFGTANTQFFYNLTGNTQLTKNVRQVTQSISPRTLAVWTLPQLHQRLGDWAYELYDQTEHPALGLSPRAAFEQRLTETGVRRQRLIAYDDAFLLATMPSTRKGTAKLIANRGVQIHGLYYWARSFSDPVLVGEHLPVRYDPFDMSAAFAYVRGRWERCFSQYASEFRCRSERELQLATAELRRQRADHGSGFTVTAKRLADFLHSAAAQEAVNVQRMRDGDFGMALSGVSAGGKLATATDRESGQTETRRGEADALPADAIYPAFPVA